MNYDATGGLTIGGCSAFKVTFRHAIKFGIGSRVYIKAKAKKGKLESIVLKKVNRVFPDSPTCMGILNEVNYIDTFNRVWMIDELVWQTEAVDLATLYWEKYMVAAQALANCNRPKLGKCESSDTPTLYPNRKC